MLLGTDYSLGSLVRLKESVAYKETSRLLSLITQLLLEGWSILNTVFYKLSLRASFLGFFFFSRANTRAKRARGASHLRLEPFRSLQNRRYSVVRLSPSGVSRAPRSYDKRQKKPPPILQAIASASCR